MPDPADLAGMYGMAYRQGFGSPDDEEELKRRKAALAGWTPQENAMQAVAGGGATPMPRGLMQPQVDSRGEQIGPTAASPMPPSDDTSVWKTAMRAGAVAPPAGGPVAAAKPLDAKGFFENYLSQVNKPGFEGEQLFPGNVTDQFTAAHPGYNPARPLASSTNPMEQARQLFIDQQANAPNMGWDQSQSLLRGQMGTLGEQMSNTSREKIGAMSDAAKIAESENRYSPKALAGQSLLTLMGALGGSGRLDPGSIKRALAVSGEIQNSLGQHPGAPGVPGGTVVGAPGAGRSPLDDLSSVDQFLSGNASLLPKEYKLSGGMDVHGRAIPGGAGQVEQFGTPEAAKFLNAMAGSNLSPEAQRDAINRIMGSEAGANVRTSLIKQAAQDELANFNPVKNLPRQGTDSLLQRARGALPGNRGGGGGQLPGDFTLAGSPFSYQPAPHTVLGGATTNLGNALFRGGNPYGQVTLKNGQVIPIEMAEAATSRMSPFGPPQKQLDQEREGRSRILANLYQALGLDLR